MDDMPVYLFTGFLESGKTSFIDETLADKRFNNGQRTLLLVCEEGEAEYDESRPYMKNICSAIGRGLSGLSGAGRNS